jgi:hypothetical protein
MKYKYCNKFQRKNKRNLSSSISYDFSYFMPYFHLQLTLLPTLQLWKNDSSALHCNIMGTVFVHDSSNYCILYTGRTQNNSAVSIVNSFETAPFFCVCPVFYKKFYKLQTSQHILTTLWCWSDLNTADKLKS